MKTLKMYLFRAVICIVIGVIIAFFGLMDNPLQDTYYSGYNELWNFIGASLFLAVLFFILSLIFSQKGTSDQE